MSFEPATEETHNAPVLDRIAEMREALAKGEDPLAVGAAAQAAKREAAADAEAEEEITTDDVAGETDEGAPPPEGEGEEEIREEEAPEEETPEEETPAVVVTLPGNAERGEEPLDIEVTDEDAAQRLRQAINDGMRRQEFKKQMAALETRRAELDFIGQSLESDPIGFMAEFVSPGMRLDLAKYLIANATEEEFAALTEAISEFDHDPRERELAALKAEKKRQTDAATRRQQQEEERAKQERAAAVVNAIEALIPDSMDERTGNRFYRNAVEEIQDYARTHRLTALEPERVAVILEKAGILKMFGITSPAGQKRTAAPPAAGSKKAPAVAPTDAKAKAEAGAARIQKRVAARKAGTAVAPTGTGAAPQRTLPPRGQTGLERIAHLRQHPELLQTRS